MATTLLLVDVQNDFHPGGSLAIPTANEDAERIVKLIQTHGSKIDRIVATMDTHHKLHIAHPGFWFNSDKTAHPEPFTIISSQDIVDGKWEPRSDITVPATDFDESVFFENNNDDDCSQKKKLIMDNDNIINLKQYAIEYTKRLEQKGRFQLCIWPEHCLIGSPGHNIVPIVQNAMNDWCGKYGKSIEFVLKGQNLLTEMYSALEADVAVSSSTTFNQSFQDSLSQNTQKLLICGQAMSHCVNYTARDIVAKWPKQQQENNNNDQYCHLSNISILTDCASAVPGFEEAATQFQKDMQDLGVKLQTSEQVFLS